MSKPETSTVRVAMTETRNAYSAMPMTVAELPQLHGKLEQLRDANLDHHEDLITHAVSQGAHVIGLGELFAGPYFALTEHPMWLELAEDAQEGPSVARMRKLAAKHAVVIVAPIYELEGGILSWAEAGLPIDG